MKTKSIWVIHLLKWLLNAIWYLNFAFIIVGIYFLVKEYVGGDSYYFNEKVTINMHKALHQQEQISGSTIVSNAKLFLNEGRIMMNVNNSVLNTIVNFIKFILLEAIVIGVLLYLRKIFSSFQRRDTFSIENVKSFKIIAILIALYFPLDWGVYLYKKWVLTHNITHYDYSFTLSWVPNFEVLLVAAVIFVMADIFKRGFEIEQENKEFI